MQTVQDGGSFSYSGRSQPLVEEVQIGDGRHIQPQDNASDASDAGLACEFDEQTPLIPQKRPLPPSQEPGDASEPFSSGRLAVSATSFLAPKCNFYSKQSDLAYTALNCRKMSIAYLIPPSSGAVMNPRQAVLPCCLHVLLGSRF